MGPQFWFMSLKQFFEQQTQTDDTLKQKGTNKLRRLIVNANNSFNLQLQITKATKESLLLLSDRSFIRRIS